MRISLEEVKALQNESVKFVRVAGEYRFCSLDQKHKTLLQPEETALSAGLIVIDEDTFNMPGRLSTTLWVGADKYDGERLAMLLAPRLRQS